MAVITSFVGVLLDAVTGMWVELSFLLFFLLGFVLLRLDLFSKLSAFQWHMGKVKKGKVAPKVSVSKAIQSEFSEGNMEAVLAAWKIEKEHGPAHLDTLKMVAQALVYLEAAHAVEELLKYLEAAGGAMLKVTSLNALLDVFARSGKVYLMEAFFHEARQRVGMKSNYQTYEILMGGYAADGNLEKVDGIVTHLLSISQKLTARGYSLTIKGFLKNGMADAALQYVCDMQRQGFYVPSFAVTQLLRVACEKQCVVKVLDAIQNDVVFPAEAISIMMEDCCKRQDMDLLRRVESLATKTGVPLLGSALDSMVKIYAQAGDPKSRELFVTLKNTVKISEGSCVGILARCAESRNLKLADQVFQYVRETMPTTIALYSSLMKVYAYSGMYDKACDIYDMVLADGLTPDSMMYGCLMKFAVECGRTDLSNELFQKTPQTEIQNYMSQIRAAGRKKDVSLAFAILKDLKASNIVIDIAAYNCVLDVCVIAGNLERANELVKDMKAMGPLDMITYNTLLKGYCVTGDLKGARKLLQEIEAEGLQANDITYNCMINTAVKKGNLEEAWDLIGSMEIAGIKADHYTLSTMMKAMKHAKSPKDVQRTLALLDRSKINVCEDEVLLNTVLDTCIRQRENQRLEQVIKTYVDSNLKPSVHTYGSLIKAYGFLKQVERCWDLWSEMKDDRVIEPNEITCGCMMDALVCNGRVEDAVVLLREWKTKHTANTIMYSCLIKGFANSRKVDRTLELFDEMLADGITPNSVTFNALIDAQARVGSMDKVEMLLKRMEECNITLDSVTYSTIIKGFCFKGFLEQALEVFEAMQWHEKTSDSIIYNTLLDGAVKHNRFDFADKLIADMESYNITPSSFTVTILLKMWGRRKQLNKAFAVVEDLPKKYGFTLNSHVFTCLISACLSNGATDRALEVFQQMKTSKSLQPDERTYSTLISGLVRVGQWTHACNAVDEAFGLCDGQPWLAAGNSIESEALESLLRLLSQRGLSEQVAVPLLERLRAAKAPVDSKLFTMSLQLAVGNEPLSNSRYNNSNNHRRPSEQGQRKRR